MGLGGRNLGVLRSERRLLLAMAATRAALFLQGREEHGNGY